MSASPIIFGPLISNDCSSIMSAVLKLIVPWNTTKNRNLCFIPTYFCENKNNFLAEDIGKMSC